MKLRRVPVFWSSLWILATVAVFCLVVPLVLIMAVSFSSSPVMSFPPGGFSLRWFHYLFQNEDWLHAIRNSLLIAAAPPFSRFSSARRPRWPWATARG